MPRLYAFLLTLALSGAAHAGTLRLHVAGAHTDGSIPQRYAYDQGGCHGRNARLPLSWQHAPAGTRSFAVSVFDPDAPTGHGWWHWFVLDLPADTHGLPQDAALPTPAFALRNDYGHDGWGGPCPPPGPAHHYVFTVYALDRATLGLTPQTPPAAALHALQSHTLDRASVTLIYGR